MIVLAAIVAFNCAQQPIIVKPRPIYTRAQRLKDSFNLLARQPVSASFLYEVKNK